MNRVKLRNNSKWRNTDKFAAILLHAKTGFVHHHQHMRQRHHQHTVSRAASERSPKSGASLPRVWRNLDRFNRVRNSTIRTSVKERSSYECITCITVLFVRV